MRIPPSPGWQPEAGAEAIVRLHALVARGYRTNLGTADPIDAVWLHHPGGAPTLILYPGGMIVAATHPAGLSPIEGHEDRIYAEDREDWALFWRFVGGIRLPTFWERTRERRQYAVAYVVIALLVFGTGWLMSIVSDWLKAVLA